MTIAYMNVATDRQHLETQREKITSFALAKGIKVDKWIMEVSGERARQPGPRLRVVTGRLREGDALIERRWTFTAWTIDISLTINWIGSVWPRSSNG